MYSDSESVESVESVESAESSAYESDDSYSDIQNELTHMTKLIGELTDQLNAAESQLQELQPHLETSYVSQMDTVAFLEKSPFRHQTFLMKAPGIPGVNLEKRYAFKDVLELLRTYLFKMGAVDDDGIITLNKQLKTLFGISGKQTTYLELIAKLRNVLM